MQTSSTTTPAGGYVAVVSVVVGLLSDFGIIIPQDTAVTAVTGIIAVIGIIHILISHFNVSKAAGIRN